MDCNYLTDSLLSCTAFKYKHTCMCRRPKGDWKKQGWIKARSARQAAHAVPHQQKRVSLCCRRALCLPRQWVFKELNARVTNTRLNHTNLQLLAITALVNWCFFWHETMNDYDFLTSEWVFLLLIGQHFHTVLHIVPTCLDCSPDWTKYMLWILSGHCMRKVRRWLFLQSAITLFVEANSYTLGLHRIRLSSTDNQQKSFFVHLKGPIVYPFLDLYFVCQIPVEQKKKKTQGFQRVVLIHLSKQNN